MNKMNINRKEEICHNPYFSRWFSAILDLKTVIKQLKVTILILVDGFLQ